MITVEVLTRLFFVAERTLVRVVPAKEEIHYIITVHYMTLHYIITVVPEREEIQLRIW